MGPWQPLTFPRKPLNFQNLPEHLDQLLQVDNEDEESQGMWHPLELGWGVQSQALEASLMSSVHPMYLSYPLPCLTPYRSSSGQVEGRLGPSTVVLDHTGGFEGLLLVDDDLLGVSEVEVWGPWSSPF